MLVIEAFGVIALPDWAECVVSFLSDWVDSGCWSSVAGGWFIIVWFFWVENLIQIKSVVFFDLLWFLTSIQGNGVCHLLAVFVYQGWLLLTGVLILVAWVWKVLVSCWHIITWSHLFSIIDAACLVWLSGHLGFLVAWCPFTVGNIDTWRGNSRLWSNLETWGSAKSFDFVSACITWLHVLEDHASCLSIIKDCILNSTALLNFKWAHGKSVDPVDECVWARPSNIVCLSASSILAAFGGWQRVSWSDNNSVWSLLAIYVPVVNA